MKTAPHRIEIGTVSVPVGFTRNRKARRYILRLLPEGVARVTIPRGGTVEFAMEFARKNRPWLYKQLQRTPPEWKHGTEIFLRGVPHRIEAVPGPLWLRVAFAGWEFDVSSETEMRSVIERRLRALAVHELTSRTSELAHQQQLEVRSVQVRDQRSRWGSCSLRKTISLNWRLIQTPEFVRDYIILHELMHLREMNHSRSFWKHVAAVCPAYLEAEQWLKKNSRLLR